MTTTYTERDKAGAILTWENVVTTWVENTWNWLGETFFTERTKPTTSYTERTKPTTTYTERSKPTTTFTGRTKPSTSWTERTAI